MKDLVRGVGAVAALALLLVGVPLGLVALAGSPFPAGVPGPDELARALTEGRVAEATFRKVLALVCWAAWGQLAFTCGLEMAAAARGRVARRRRGLRLFHGVAAALVTAVLVGVSGARSAAPPPERRPLTLPHDPVAGARAVERRAEAEARRADEVLARLRMAGDPLPEAAPDPPTLRLPSTWPEQGELAVPPVAPDSLVAALAGAGVFAGGLVWSLNRRRRERERLREPGQRPEPSPEVGVERAVRAAAGDDVAAVVDEALRAFAHGAEAAGWAPPLAGVNVAREVSLLFSAPAPEAFPGFAVEDGGYSWVATAGSLRAAGPFPTVPAHPALVTVGHTGRSEVLLNLEAPGSLAVVGEPADVSETLFGMALELATGPRAGSVPVVVVGVDPALAGVEGIEWHASLPEVVPEGGVLLCEDGPDVAQALAAGACAVVGGDHAARWRLRVAGERAELEPLGVTLERHRLPAGARPALARLLRADATAPAVTRPRLFVVGADDDGPAVEVRVLGPVDVQGGAAPFRRRKALELVVYLALHRRGVDGDVLAEALWPGRLVSADTLHAATSAARRCLGAGDDGEPYLPPATDGSYRLHEAVALDLDRFSALVADAETALAAESPRAARAVLRQALGLVRGRPFTTPGGEYLWAHAEAVVSAVTAEVADAAHLLATLYLDGGDARGAWWATRQGLLASPGNEQLHRDRMRAADLAGNPAAVEDVMEELCRAIEVDRSQAHRFLHPRTVELYERLTRRGARLAASR